ncbi:MULTISPECIES: CPBP family intramembrane glutamic endopeptidase [Psychrilyobacter]|uniref:CPBP family intramembrane metalloprotease n=1 Tax=Psychrilyobacter piezotolerans TaxID=2293438 RepID=A0ABX9KDP2_9FUSO|nr:MULTISPECIES: CPBP family intramembrane glutamic endopeptidase [Psychrilyobacter]MCS5422473.1 CPBP family intramembrane metalloprotease [Psychrilyobacter sp. S5]NDI79015.1 CPBP family intramembrane metalloprotease [Psychrilyobacter piezotolerans]RDE59098.1 CPBP family intramembrane metalloprotease [Psychrilyobacter sp. S5]REI39669.1 CPBP family intramembrane metalloprotease [Psychrilyobacter piezotolerans]
MEQIIERKKASNFITLLLFFVFIFISVFIGNMILNNKDLISIIADTTTFLVLLFYFQLKKGLLKDINFKVRELEFLKILKVLFYSIIYSISGNFILWFLSTYTNLKFSGVTENIGPYNKTYIGWLIFSISITIFPAVVEETVFRGVLLKNLIFKYGFKVAVLTTCIIFSFIHGVSNFMCIFPKINYISGDSPNKMIFLFIFALPFILRKLYQIFILEKNSFKF